MKQFNASAVVLLASAVLLAGGLVSCGPSIFDPISRDELLSNLNADGNQLSANQVSKVLHKADAKTRLGRIGVADLMRLDDISMEHCNKKELDQRFDTCRSATGKNLREFCEYRHREQVAFCVDRLEGLMRRNLVDIGLPVREELKHFRTALRRHGLSEQSEGQSEKVRSAIKKFLELDELTDERFKEGVKDKCETVVNHFVSVESILNYSGHTIEELTSNYSLLDAFKLFKICQVLVSNKETLGS